jgi:acetylornithine deacetylase/succinyl-diaminopimelate desuccinylase-like protein
VAGGPSPPDAADSKAYVALLSELLAYIQRESRLRGRIGVLFDCEEHSGLFGGAREFFDHPDDSGRLPRPDGVFIGYPSNLFSTTQLSPTGGAVVRVASWGLSFAGNVA